MTPDLVTRLREADRLFNHIPGLQSEAAAEIDRLRGVLQAIAGSRPMWNGGIARHTNEYLYDFINLLREDAQAALADVRAGK